MLKVWTIGFISKLNNFISNFCLNSWCFFLHNLLWLTQVAVRKVPPGTTSAVRIFLCKSPVHRGKLDDNYGLSKKASTINHSVVLLLFGNWFFIKLVLRYESGLCQAIRDHLCPVSLITAPESDYELVISVSYGDKEVISI